MTRKLGIAVIGLGPASLPHSKSLLDLAGRAEVRWAVSRTPDRAEAYAAQFPFPTTTDLDAVLADPAVDAAIVLTPPSSHLDVSALCLEAGKHVLVEKPLELTSERGQRLVDTARRTGRTFGVTLQHRFRPASLRLKAALESEIANARSAPRQADDPFEAYVSTLAPRAQDWLRSHRDLVTDEGKRSQLERAHYSALSDGIAPNTDAYYERLEERMGLRQRAPEPERRQPSQAATAAPVSRGATGGGSVTQVSLSAKEREAARFSGLSDAEYARQKLDLLRSGEIGNARH